MHTVPDLDDVESILANHARWCQLGERRCVDCRAARDPRTIRAVTIANIERVVYGEWISKHDWLCIYCGAFAEHADHLVPKPWTGSAARRFVPVVPSCADCNLRINDALRFTIAERAGIAAESLRRKYRKDLDIPDRDDDWFADFSDRMRRNLRASQARRREIRRRLIVLDSGGAPCVSDELWIAAA